MKRKTILDSIDVPKPCSANWDEMTGGDEVRFCSFCEKDIYNLSAMNRQKAEKLVKDSKGKICVRYEKNSQGKIVTAPPKLTQITRRATIAAGVLATTLSLSTMSYAQGEPIIRNDKSKNIEEKADKKSISKQGLASISGNVKDSGEGLIPVANITLIDLKTMKTFQTNVNFKGFYEFKDIPPSIYELIVESLGFKKTIYTSIEIQKDSILKKDIILEISEATNCPLPDTDYKKVKATISGKIRDSAGAILQNVKLILKNKKTKKSLTIYSKKDGSYQFLNLESGKYEFRVEMQGFKKTKIKDLKITEDSRIEKDFILEGNVEVTIGLIVISEE